MPTSTATSAAPHATVFWVDDVAVQPMPRPHLHHEVALALCTVGGHEYSANGRRYRTTAGEVLLRWAGVPHQVLVAEPGTRALNANIPVPWFLSWGLPAAAVERLVTGEPLVDVAPESLADELVAWRRWQRLLAHPTPEKQHVAALEIEARIRRLFLQAQVLAPLPAPRFDTLPASFEHVERMTRYLTEHAADPALGVAEVAAAVGLTPHYATTLFHRHTGHGPGECIAQQRIAIAQRLLALTDRKVLDIALESGFATVAQFYTAFTHHTGQPPDAYRAAIRNLPPT